MLWRLCIYESPGRLAPHMNKQQYVIALALAAASPAFANLTINEVYYNVSPQAGNQYVELYNAGSTNCYLDGMVLTDEADTGSEGIFKFPGTVGGTTYPVAPGAFVVIAVDATNNTAGADWECFAGMFDTDNPSVPNLTLVSGSSDLSLFPGGDNVILATGSSTTAPIDTASIVDGMNYAGGDGELAQLSPSATDPSPGPTATTGNALCRCADGTDSDTSSSADFVARAITRGTANACTGPGILLADTYGLEGTTSNPAFTFTVTLTGTSDVPVTVNYATSNGTAQAGLDYTHVTNGLVSFSPGVTSQTLSITVLADALPESNEYFYVFLYDPANGSLSDGLAQGVIGDDDTSHGVTLFTRGGTVITATWSSAAGQVYQPQYSGSLVAPAWTDLGGPITAAAATASTTDNASGTTQRFYRVLWLQ
jgi:hypothetical protein